MHFGKLLAEPHKSLVWIRACERPVFISKPNRQAITKHLQYIFVKQLADPHKSSNWQHSFWTFGWTKLVWHYYYGWWGVKWQPSKTFLMYFGQTIHWIPQKFGLHQNILSAKIRLGYLDEPNQQTIAVTGHRFAIANICNAFCSNYLLNSTQFWFTLEHPNCQMFSSNIWMSETSGPLLLWEE